MLEGRDAEGEIERCVREWERADVGYDRSKARYVGPREIDTDDLVRTEPDEACEVGRLRERVTDVEHAPLAGVAREAPRNLQRSLVAFGRCLQLTGAPWAAELGRPRPLGRCERERAVEQRHPPELVATHELPDEGRSRERPFAQLRERALAAVGLGRPAEHEQPDAIDELLVRARRRLEPGVEVSLHDTRLE